MGSITVLLTSCLTGLDKSVLQIKTKIVSCHTDDSKPVKQEINCTVILSLLAFPGLDIPMLFTSLAWACLETLLPRAPLLATPINKA